MKEHQRRSYYSRNNLMRGEGKKLDKFKQFLTGHFNTRTHPVVQEEGAQVPEITDLLDRGVFNGFNLARYMPRGATYEVLNLLETNGQKELLEVYLNILDQSITSLENSLRGTPTFNVEVANSLIEKLKILRRNVYRAWENMDNPQEFNPQYERELLGLVQARFFPGVKISGQA